MASQPNLNVALEPMKWLAVLSMVADHAVKFLMPEPDLLMLFFGRLALPLFTWIIALRLVEKPSRLPEYMKRFFIWGLISEPAFWALTQTGGVIQNPLNIFFTFFCGGAMLMIFERARVRKIWLFALPPVLVLSVFVDYGIAGAAFLPALVFLARRSPQKSAAWLGPIGAVVNASILIGTAAINYILLAPALMTSLLAWESLKLRRPLVPRLPGWFFYAFYPAHLTLIWLLPHNTL